MKVSLWNLGEVVMAASAGIGLARACGHGHPLGHYGFRWVVEPFLAGVGLVGMCTIGWESMTRREKKPWGIGRWTWMIAGLYVLIDLVTSRALGALIELRRNRPQRPLFNGAIGGQISVLFHNQICWFVLAMWVVKKLSGSLRDPEPDFREAAGRIFSALIVAWGTFYNVEAIIRGTFG